jgi:hypothetical protein
LEEHPRQEEHNLQTELPDFKRGGGSWVHADAGLHAHPAQHGEAAGRASEQVEVVADFSELGPETHGGIAGFALMPRFLVTADQALDSVAACR